MRVLYWTEMFWPYIGGIEVLATQLLPALSERGHEVIVVTSHGSLDLPDEARYKGIPIHRFPFLQALAAPDLGKLMEAQRRLAKLKEDFEPDLVHMNFSGPSVLFHLRTAVAHPAPFLFTLRGPLPNNVVDRNTLIGRALRAADWVTGCSAAVLAEARQQLPEITPYSSVIHNGLDAPSLPPGPLPTDPARLLCLGRLVPDKGFDLALAAFASLVDRFPHMRLIIAGDGPSRAELEQQAAALRLTRVVDFVGWVTPENVPALMNAATLVVMPSRWEGLPIVALQAAMMARPIVATCAWGLSEVVVHGQTGLLVEKENSDALAEAISFLLERPETAAKMGTAGRLRAQELFSLERHVDAYDALYRKLVRRSAHVDPVGPGRRQ